MIEQDREDEQKLNIIGEIPEITLPESLVNIIDFLFDLLANGLKLIKHVFVVVREKVRCIFSKFLPEREISVNSY